MARLENQAVISVLCDDHCIATWRHCLIAIWRRTTTNQGAAALRESLSKLTAANPGGVGIIAIIENHAAAPDADARRALAAAFRDHAPSIRAAAIVHEGTGFRGAAIRSIVTGVSLLIRPGYPHNVTASVDAGASWLAPLIADTQSSLVTPTMLKRVIADLRMKFGHSGQPDSLDPDAALPIG
jgi:hypothetical protein